MSTRVPAWKRLGLKLKYAKETPDDEELSRFQHSQRKQTNDTRLELDNHDAKTRLTKRRRLNAAESSQTKHSARSINGQSQHELSRQPNHAIPPVTQPQLEGQGKHVSALKKRKSVSFNDEKPSETHDIRTNGDKVSDSLGSLVNGIGHKSDRKSISTTVSGSTNHVPEPEDMEELSEPTELPQPLGANGKAGKKRKLRQAESAKKPTAALDYLNQHHQDRKAWKFNKNRDVWILNHAHDEKAIPRSYDLALSGYVHGLPSQAASRDRLVSECTKALESNSTNVSALATDQAKKEFLSQLQDTSTSTRQTDLLEQVSELPRSLILLWALGVSDPVINSKPRANKKSRTSAPIDLSSSDTSDSDSDSSSDSSTSEKSMEGQRKGPGNGTSGSSGVEDDTSSSGSDTSSDSD